MTYVLSTQLLLRAASRFLRRRDGECDQTREKKTFHSLGLPFNAVNSVLAKGRIGMTVLTSVAWVVSCPLLHAACLRWILTNTSIGPCFAVAVGSAPAFAASLIFGLLQGRGRVAATGVIEDGLDMSSYCVLSLLTAAFHILQAFALGSDFVSVGVYAAFTLLDEILCPWISSMILRRPLRLGMIAGGMSAAAAIFFSSFAAYRPENWWRIGIRARHERISLLSICIAAGARIVYVLRGVLSKQLVLEREAKAKAKAGSEKGASVSVVPAKSSSRIEISSPRIREKHLFRSRRKGSGALNMKIEEAELKSGKIDSAFDSIMYDTEFVDGCLWKTLKLHAFGGNFVLLPIAIIGAFGNGEEFSSVSTLFCRDAGCIKFWGVAGAAAFCMVVRPLAAYGAMLWGGERSFARVRMISIVAAMGYTVVTINGNVSPTMLLALLFALISIDLSEWNAYALRWKRRVRREVKALGDAIAMEGEKKSALRVHIDRDDLDNNLSKIAARLDYCSFAGIAMQAALTRDIASTLSTTNDALYTWKKKCYSGKRPLRPLALPARHLENPTINENGATASGLQHRHVAHNSSKLNIPVPNQALMLGGEQKMEQPLPPSQPPPPPQISRQRGKVRTEGKNEAKGRSSMSEVEQGSDFYDNHCYDDDDDDDDDDNDDKDGKGVPGTNLSYDPRRHRKW